MGLNALSGIGGVRTGSVAQADAGAVAVLMPCRALEAFGHGCIPCSPLCAGRIRLNALSGIGGVRTDSVALKHALLTILS